MSQLGGNRYWEQRCDIGSCMGCCMSYWDIKCEIGTMTVDDLPQLIIY